MSFFFKFISAWLRVKWMKWRGYRIISTPDEQLRRLGKCNVCPEFDDGICRACGCLTYAKVMLTSEECPKRLWLRVKDRPVTVK